MSDVRTLNPKRDSVHTVLTQLQQHLPQIEGIFCIVKTKDGAYDVLTHGHTGDLAYALALLTKVLQDNL